MSLPSGKPSIHATTGIAVEGGAFLKSLWARTGPRRAIAAGPWDVVVLQEDLPETMDGIADAHRAAAAVLKADVAPVGLAWRRASEQRPELTLYISCIA